MNDKEFITSFENCSIPREQWSHEAHLRMAWIYLTRYPLEQALDKICSGIRRYNMAVTGSTDQYHHTVTIALLYPFVAFGTSFAFWHEKDRRQREINLEIYRQLLPCLSRWVKPR